MFLKDFATNPFKEHELRRWITIRPSPFIHQKIRPTDGVDKIAIPTLFIAGGLCTIKSFNDTKSLFYKAKCEKKFELFEHCIHADDMLCQEKLINICAEWFLAFDSLLEN